MKRVQLSTWRICAETGVRLEKFMLAYQDTTTKEVFAMNSERVRKHLLDNQEDGCIIPNEEPCRETQENTGL